MDPEQIFDDFQQRESGLLTRRGLLTGAAVGAAAVLVPARAKASISALMCPPEAGSFGGDATGAGASGGGGLVDGDEDYSSAVPDDGPGLRHLTMRNGRTGETYDRDFVVDGQFVPDALEEFNRFARDWRQNEVKTMDPNAINIVWKIWRMIGTSTPFNLNSGYRSPATNSSLPGAAKQSYHMRGKALDLSNPSVSPANVHKAAMTLWAGGVGRYDTFTHVDSGPKRRWG
jgi:uncharacterized protein YcbK (DUF882 family)